MKEESLDRMASGRGKGAWLKISTALSCLGVAVYLIQLCMCRLTKPFSWFHPLLPDIHQFGLYTVPDRTSQFAFIKASSSKKKIAIFRGLSIKEKVLSAAALITFLFYVVQIPIVLVLVDCVPPH